MKVKQGFILRQVGGNYTVIAVNSAVKDFSGMISLNETGADLWKLLEKGCDKKDLISYLVKEYEITEETALKDVEKFIEKAKEAKLLEEF